MAQASSVPTPRGIEEQHWTPLPPWHRRASPLSLVVFGAVLVLAFTGLLGHERDWSASGGGARLDVHAPEIIRNGEFMEIRVRVVADHPVDALAIGFGQGLWEDVTVNTMIPAADTEHSVNGEFRFDFGSLESDTPFLLKVDVQINPDILGGNSGRITVYDGGRPLTSLEPSIAVLP